MDKTGHIDLEGLSNTRDLGYLKTESGQNLAPHKLIRSGTLAEATDSDLSVLLDEFEVRTVIDMRTDEEIEKNPDPQEKMPDVRFLNTPILGFSTTGITRENGLVGMVKKISTMATMTFDPKKLMIDLYPNMLLDEMGMKGYAKFFEILIAADDHAVLWHCSAGKDRAGLATVLLLHTLGVAWPVIVADYLLTNKYLAGRTDDLKKLIPEQYQTDSLIKGLAVINSADEAFLNAGIKGVEKHYGSLDNYLEQALGVTKQARKTLQEKYLRQ